MVVKLLQVTVCSDCRHCSRSAPVYSALCYIMKTDDGFWGKRIDKYPYIPDWCPLPDAEGEE